MPPPLTTPSHAMAWPGSDHRAQHADSPHEIPRVPQIRVPPQGLPVRLCRGGDHAELYEHPHHREHETVQEQDASCRPPYRTNEPPPSSRRRAQGDQTDHCRAKFQTDREPDNCDQHRVPGTALRFQGTPHGIKEPRTATPPVHTHRCIQHPEEQRTPRTHPPRSFPHPHIAPPFTAGLVPARSQCQPTAAPTNQPISGGIPAAPVLGRHCAWLPRSWGNANRHYGTVRIT